MVAGRIPNAGMASRCQGLYGVLTKEPYRQGKEKAAGRAGSERRHLHPKNTGGNFRGEGGVGGNEAQVTVSGFGDQGRFVSPDRVGEKREGGKHGLGV